MGEGLVILGKKADLPFISHAIMYVGLFPVSYLTMTFSSPKENLWGFFTFGKILVKRMDMLIRKNKKE
jgi:hypothetical protein